MKEFAFTGGELAFMNDGLRNFVFPSNVFHKTHFLRSCTQCGLIEAVEKDTIQLG
jgi:hypothetical protein